MAASILQEYIEQRGVTLPEGYLSCKVIIPNPKFWYEIGFQSAVYLFLLVSFYVTR